MSDAMEAMMSERLILVGGGGFAREAMSWWRKSNLREIPIAGFLDDGDGSLQLLRAGVERIGSPREYVPRKGDNFVFTLGEPKAKKELCWILMGKGAKFRTLVHETAVVGDRTDVGEGCILCPAVVATADIKIGTCVLLNVAASVGHDATIGDWSTLSGHVDVTGGVTVEEGVFFGTHASAVPGVRLGAWSVVGAGSVVTKDIPANTTVVGIPAKALAPKLR